MKNGGSQLRGWSARIEGRKAIGAVLLAAALGAGCGPGAQTRYYTLRTPPPPISPRPQTNLVLQVERFDAPEMLRDDRIVYYTSPTELNFHQNHRWSASPTALLSDLAVKYFAETGLFKHVYDYPAPVHADYTLRGRVLDFAEMDYEKSGNGKLGTARVGLNLDLVRTRDNEVVWSARKVDEAPIASKGMRGVVKAMNAASQKLMLNAYSGIAAVVKRESARE